MQEESVLKVLSKLMSVEARDNGEEGKGYEEIYQYFRQNLLVSIEKSRFPQKAQIRYELQGILDHIKFLSDFPMLQGKTIIGILGTRRESEYEFTQKFFPNGINKLINSTVPMVLYHHPVRNVIAQNKLDNRVQLEGNEYYVCSQLWKEHKIDIRRLVDLFVVGTEADMGEMVYVYIPFLALQYTDEYQKLLNIIDCMLVCCSSKEENTERLERLKRKYSKTVITVPMDRECEDELLNYKKDNNYFSIISRYDVKKILWEQWNVPRNNIVFSNSVHLQMLRIQTFLFEEWKEQESLLEQIKGNLLHQSDENSSKKIREYYKVIEEQYEITGESYSKIRKDTSEMLERIIRYEKERKSVVFGDTSVDVSENISYRTSYIQECVEIVAALIELKELAAAGTYIGRLERCQYQNLDLIKAYLDYAGKGKEKLDAFKRAIVNAKGDWLYNRLVVRFYKELGISDDAVANKIKDKAGDYTKEENYFLGEYLSNKQPQLAYQHLYEALKQGDRQAGSKIFQIPQINLNEDQMEELAGWMVPEANYEIGRENVKDNFPYGLRHLKIAAALGHIEAIKEVAQLEYQRICKIEECKNVIYGKQSKLHSTGLNGTIQNLLKVYFYLTENDQKDGYHEEIGILYYLLRDYQNARRHLTKPKTALSNLVLGIIYEHGYGVAIKLETARNKYKKAQREIPQAGAAIERINANLDRIQQSRDDSENTEEIVDYQEGDKSLCFITTAICQSLGKDDDCQELVQMREYRNNVLLNEEDGKALIYEYYRIAPAIVKKIDATAESSEVYRRLYMTYIKPILRHLNQKEYRTVKEKYIGMVRELQDKYL